VGGTITYDGTAYDVVKTEFETAAWVSDDGSIRGKSHLMKFYFSSARYLQLSLYAAGDMAEVAGSYELVAASAVRLNAVTGFISQQSATGTGAAEDLMQGAVRITGTVKDGKNMLVVSIAKAATRSGKSVSFDFMGEHKSTDGSNTGDPDPALPELGQLVVDGVPHSITGCEISYSSAQLMRVELTGSGNLAFEAYVQAADAATRPLLNGDYTVDYLDDDGTDWGNRFNNIITTARTGVKFASGGEWSSGLVEGTQVKVSMSSQKINLSIKNARVNVVSHVISLEYDNVYVWK
jgi:hypothetical protein